MPNFENLASFKEVKRDEITMIIFIILVQIIFIIAFPYLFFKFKGIERKQRLGYFDKVIKKSIWIHAASVGEINAVKPLLKTLVNKYPKKTFILTTMTSTGQETAKKIDDKIYTAFLPFDCFFMMKSFFKRINPELIILVETEFWPLMLWFAKKRNIPVVVVNGRISDKSYPLYKRFSFFWKPLWKAVSAVNAQSEKDLERFIFYDFKNVINTHNLKFCLQLPGFEKYKIRKELRLSKKDFVIVWGSSRPGEEKLLKSIYQELNNEISNLKVIIVPRHLNRLQEITEIFDALDFQLYSKLKEDYKILIVDQMGILTKVYSIADIAIVGGSFFDFGGHNPLEPAFYETPMIMGEDFSSCRDSVLKLIKNNGIQISSKERLIENIVFLYKNKEMMKNLGLNAKRTLQENSASLEKNIKALERFIK